MKKQIIYYHTISVDIDRDITPDNINNVIMDYFNGSAYDEVQSTYFPCAVINDDTDDTEALNLLNSDEYRGRCEYREDCGRTDIEFYYLATCDFPTKEGDSSSDAETEDDIDADYCMDHIPDGDVDIDAIGPIDCLWYACMTDSDDSWDTGSFSISEAIDWLKNEDSDDACIAIIDDNFCVGEITKEDL